MPLRMITALAAAALLAVPAAAHAFKLQKPELVEAGTITFGGGLTFESLSSEPDIDNADTTDTTTIGIAPRVGYFVMPNLEVGLGLHYRSATSKTGSADEIETSGFGVGAYGHYYFRFLEKNALYPYVGIGLDYQSDELPDVSTTSGTDIKPGIGLALAIGSKTGGFMKLDLGYLIRSRTTSFEMDGLDDLDVSTSGLVVGLGFGLYLR